MTIRTDYRPPDVTQRNENLLVEANGTANTNGAKRKQTPEASHLWRFLLCYNAAMRRI